MGLVGGMLGWGYTLGIAFWDEVVVDVDAQRCFGAGCHGEGNS